MKNLMRPAPTQRLTPLHRQSAGAGTGGRAGMLEIVKVGFYPMAIKVAAKLK